MKFYDEKEAIRILFPSWWERGIYYGYVVFYWLVCKWRKVTGR